jgi:hypothetical protein
MAMCRTGFGRGTPKLSWTDLRLEGPISGEVFRQWQCRGLLELAIDLFFWSRVSLLYIGSPNRQSGVLVGAEFFFFFFETLVGAEFVSAFLFSTIPLELA